MSETREAHLKTYIGVLLALALALGASWVYWYGLDTGLRLILGTAILACFTLLGDIFPVRVSERTVISASAVALMVAVAALGPTWAAVAAIPSALFVGRRNPLRMIYEIGHSVTTVYLAGIVFSLVSDPLLVGSSASPAAIFYGTLIAGLVFMGTSETVNCVLLKVKYGQAFQETWNSIIQPYLLSNAISVLTAGISILALAVYGPVAALVVVTGSVISQTLVYRSREQVKEIRRLKERVASLEEALTTSNTTFGTMIIRDLGRRDGYTHRHAAATAVYAADLAAELKLGDVRVGRLRMAGLLHNIGLFSLPEDLLLTTGKLNSIAWSKMSEHPVRSEQALAAVSEFKEMAGWVRWHHERIDGRGYPDKLRGPWIPLEAKILAVAQAYAAMVLDQPRRPGMTPAEARKRLTNGIDTEFDGVIVRAFLRILDTETEGYRMADDYRFLFPAPEGERPATPLAREQSLES